MPTAEIVYGVREIGRLVDYEVDGSDLRMLDFWEDEDYYVFNAHLMRCYLIPIGDDVRNAILTLDTEYFGLFVDDGGGARLVARASVERYSPDKWEVADVCAEPAYRRRGYEEMVVSAAAKFIFANGRMPTMRAYPDDRALIRVIANTGFVQIGVVVE